MISFTLYLSVTSLDQVTDAVTNHMVTHNLQKHPIVKMEIVKGLPHSDYGQTVVVHYDETKDSTDFPVYELKYKNKVLMGE